MSHLASEGLVQTTIKSYLSAIRFLYITAGYGDLFTPVAFPRLQYVLRGIKRAPRQTARPRLPITPSILRSMKAVWVSNSADADCIMLWAACCMGFFGFMRAGEFTLKSAQDFNPSACLTPQDVAVDQHSNPSMLRVHLQQSKTDPFRHGVDIHLGRTDSTSGSYFSLCSHPPSSPRPLLHVQGWFPPN